MPGRRRLTPPAYPKKAHSSGQARIRLNGEQVYLGVFGSAESHAEYRRVLAEWEGAQQTPTGTTSRVKTVEDLLYAIGVWAATKYREKQHLQNVLDAIRPVRRLYADAKVETFGPVALKACRAEMLKTCCRNTANARVRIIQLAWREMVAAELIPVELSHRLDTVSGLRAGEGGAVDYEAVGPVPEADLAATLPHLPPQLRALVELQLLTGARPGELVGLRPGDLHRGDRVELRKGHYLQLGGCWARVFRGAGVARRAIFGRTDQESSTHKTSHHGHTRVLLFGTRAQEILAPLLDGVSAGTAVFRNDAGRAHTTKTYSRSIARAVEAANRGRACEACRAAKAAVESDRRRAKAGVERLVWRPWESCAACAEAAVGHWHAHQLRHNAATYVVAQFGDEVARLILGHKTLAMTRRYALDPLAKALPAVAGLEAAAVRVTSGAA